MLGTFYEETLNGPVRGIRFLLYRLGKFKLVAVFLLHRVQEPFHAVGRIGDNAVERFFVKALVAYIHRVDMAQRVLKDDSGVLTAINDCGDLRDLAQRLTFLYSVNLSLGVMFYELGQEMSCATSII